MDRLSQMQAFVQVCDQGSFSAAAETLERSCAAISRAVEQLEASLGARLLQRTTRRLQVTEIGEQVLAHCRQMLQMQDSLQDVVTAGQAQLHGTIRLAVSSSLIQAGLDQVLAAFICQYPALRLEVFTADQTVDLLEAKIDLALRISPQLGLGVVARQLAECHSVLCATPQYLADAGIPVHLADLAAHRCLSHQRVGRTLWRLAPHAHVQQAAPLSPLWIEQPIKTVLSCNDTVSLLLLTRQHLGISMLPRALVLADLASGVLVTVLPEYQPESLPIYAVYASRHYLPQRVRQLLDFLQQQLSQDPRWQLAPDA